MMGFRKLRVFGLSILIILGSMTLPGCHASYYKVPITKSRKHFRPYDDKKDRGRPRVKTRKYKSLKHTKRINDQ